MDGKARVMKIVFMNKEADGRAGTAAGKSQNVCQNISDGAAALHAKTIIL